jgi:hypothetical protein
MRRKAFIGALLLIGVGVVLGATVFRTDLAQATGLAHSVTVDNTAANPVPVREQNLDGFGNIKVHEQGTAAVRSVDEEVATHAGAVNTQISSCLTDLYQVPAGKLLVIEYISAEGGGSGTLGATSASGEVFAVGSNLGLPLLFQQQTPGLFNASEAVHYSFPGGTLLRFSGSVEGVDSCSFTIAMGGHLQPNP